jgi:hypothetical protein
MVKIITSIVMTVILIISTEASTTISRSQYEAKKDSHLLVHTVRIAYTHENGLDFNLAILELYQSNCQ